MMAGTSHSREIIEDEMSTFKSLGALADGASPHIQMIPVNSGYVGATVG